MAVVSLAYANNLYGWLEWKRRIENMSTFSMRESMPIANYQECFNYEKERLERLEAAQRIEKNNLAIDNNKVEHIIVDEVKEENIIANTEKIVETEEKI